MRPPEGREGGVTMVISRRRLLASAAALGASSVSAGISAPAIAQNKPLRIGILAPRSGIAAAPGLNGIRAVQWATERYNSQGGIGGRKVEVVTERHDRALQQARAAGPSGLCAGHHLHRRRSCARPRGRGGTRSYDLLGWHDAGRRQ